MKSKASVKGHPIHPMLVGFPIALFLSTIGLELAYVATHDPFYFRAAMVANIAGVVMALIAAIPGSIDLFSLPAHSPARATGRKHALFMLQTVAVFLISAVLLSRSWIGREVINGGYTLDAYIPLALGMVGIVSMTFAGALGFSLVQTHHVGIHPTILRTSSPRELPARNYGAPLHH